MEMESNYIVDVNKHILRRDIKELRKQLVELHNVKKPTSKEMQVAVQIESEIDETEKYRQMIDSSREKSEDLRKQIKMYRKGLWK